MLMSIQIHNYQILDANNSTNIVSVIASVECERTSRVLARVGSEWKTSVSFFMNI